MTQQRYAFQGYDPKKMARVLGVSLPVSSKVGYELCNHLRGKKIKQAYAILEKVIALEYAIPFRRYNMDLAHKTKIGPGSYPEKAAGYVLKLIKSAEANAQYKGLSVSDLVIIHICCHKASSPWRAGRQRRRKAKRAHFEIVAAELSEKSEKTKK
ncbi:50S ribosomal protein L22 [Candidatus Woesearchaeota archaeon]|nr:50S ribosomal protein L22P [uncultured archaeon]MBS3136794.1 50S ribosomal protein L22 [Candidatus Woesearchaeota archaeon]